MDVLQVVETLRAARTARGYSTRTMAQLASEVSGTRKYVQSTISKIETGQRELLVDDLLTFAAALDVVPEAFLTGTAVIDIKRQELLALEASSAAVPQP